MKNLKNSENVPVETTTEVENSFHDGWMQVKQKDAQSVKIEIMDSLHITADPSWYARLFGRVNHKSSERRVIESVFAKYGITQNIWGNATANQ